MNVQESLEEEINSAFEILTWLSNLTNILCTLNRQFLEITGEDNLTVFSYSGRVKSPEWRWQWRRANLQQF